MKTLLAKSDEEATANADDLVKGIVKEIEPLLANAGPFFGGSQKLTLAEVSELFLRCCPNPRLPLNLVHIEN